MKLTSEEARDIVCEDTSTWQLVEEDFIDNTRWSIIYCAIHRHLESGKCYEFNYSVGATECQDESPYEFEDEVIVKEVHQVEKTVLVWESK